MVGSLSDSDLTKNFGQTKKVFDEIFSHKLALLEYFWPRLITFLPLFQVLYQILDQILSPILGHILGPISGQILSEILGRSLGQFLG